MNETEEIFNSNGGKFHIPFQDFHDRLKGIRGFVFDWDGVFTNGAKMHGGNSSFSEIDSMGLNLLRFGWYLETGEVPFCFIITGLHNATAIEFAKREKFHGVFLSFKAKKLALNYILDNFSIRPSELAFFYDDVLDLSLCSEVGLRFQVTRRSNPVFNNYVEKQRLTDYSTASEGGNHALRECAELCLSALGLYDKTLEHRIEFSELYREYWELRQRMHSRFYIHEGQEVKVMEY